MPLALQPTLHHGLLLVMVLTMVINMVRYLREMISQYPEIGFPLIWLPSTHRPVRQLVSNKLNQEQLVLPAVLRGGRAGPY
jgi:ethanolaminephosphotransferase